MLLKTKVMLLLIISNLLLFVAYISLANQGIAEAYSFTEMPNFEKTINKSVELFNKSRDISELEKADYKSSATNLMSEYQQRKVFQEEVTSRLLKKIFWYFLPFLVIIPLIVFLFFSNFTAPLNRLAKLMGKYPEIESEDLTGKAGSKELTVLYAGFSAMHKKISEYEILLRKEEKVSGWMEMSRAIVHEMNNFLMPLENHLNSLTKSISPANGSMEELQNVNRSFLETKRVIANMRSFYSAKRNEAEKVNLNDDLSFICAGYQAEFINLTNRSVEVVIDRLELNQVVVNLIKNGKESVAEDKIPKVSITLEQTDQEIKILVKDNGTGIASTDLASIFDPGFTSKKNGLGFGLALVQKIVTLNRWKIAVDSKIDCGTTFTLTIPEQPNHG